MSQLRRVDGRSSLWPVAAEVLEIRSLLSAGAAAVGSAVQHAGAMTPATTSSVPGTLEIIVLNQPQDFSGTLSVPPIHQTVGAHVQVHFKSNTVDGETFSVSVSAKVASVDFSHGPLGIVTLSNVKGSLSVVIKQSGHTSTQRVVVSNAVIYLEPNGSLAVLTADFAPKKPGTNVSGTLSLTPE